MIFLLLSPLLIKFSLTDSRYEKKNVNRFEVLLHNRWFREKRILFTNCYKLYKQPECHQSVVVQYLACKYSLMRNDSRCQHIWNFFHKLFANLFGQKNQVFLRNVSRCEFKHLKFYFSIFYLKKKT